MDTKTIEQLIANGIPNAEITVTENSGKFEARIVSPLFADKNTLKRHKLVYATLSEQITSGAIHALTIKSFTPDEVS